MASSKKTSIVSGVEVSNMLIRVPLHLHYKVKLTAIKKRISVNNLLYKLVYAFCSGKIKWEDIKGIDYPIGRWKHAERVKRAKEVQDIVNEVQEDQVSGTDSGSEQE